MAITIDFATKIISVPQADLTMVSATEYTLDTDAFHITLRDLEATEAGGPNPTTHTHNTEVTLGGLTFARLIEIIGGYTITFENGSYAVTLLGSNNNILDVANLNSVSIRPTNSAGLILDPLGDISAIAAGVWAEILEGTLDATEVMRIMLSALAGKSSGGGTGTVAFRDDADSKDRISATVDSTGDRTAVTKDGT